MKILAIETSCDDTGIAVLDARKMGRTGHCLQPLASVVHTQDIHANYGGVFPMMAKREHDKNIVPVFEKALKDAKLFTPSPFGHSPFAGGEKTKSKIRKILEKDGQLAEAFVEIISKIEKPKIDAIAVTVGPGLEPGLWVGICFAKVLALVWDLPVIPVNHMEGHVLSILLQKDNIMPKIEFPALALLVSGGHTELVLMKDFGKYKVIGATRDDAAGEAFDKVARMLGLPYPGGPEISKLADMERKNLIPLPLTKGEAGRGSIGSDPSSILPLPRGGKTQITLPRPMLHSKDYDFSFSGLKTAVLYLLRDTENIPKEKIAREFEDATVEVLVAKTMRAMKEYKAQTLIVGGGVSANMYLQKTLKNRIKKEFPKSALYFPTKGLSTDNALMIAIAGYFTTLNKGIKKSRSLSSLKANGNLGFHS